MELNKLKIIIQHVKTKSELKKLIPHIKVLASNMRANRSVIQLIHDFILVANQISDFKSGVILKGLLILQYVHLADKLEETVQLIEEMQTLAKTINYKEGLAFSHSFAWYKEKIKGNKERARQEISKAKNIINELKQPDEFVFHFIMYAFAIEKWMDTHDLEVVRILESCSVYFYNNNLNRSFIHTLNILGIIYSRTQNSKEILETSKKIFNNRFLFESLPLEARAISYYFVGLGYFINLNLNLAETFFEESYSIFRIISKESIYFSNFIILHSYIVTVKALQGKLNQSLELIKESESLLKKEFFKKNLDKGTKRQINHTLNLNKFYVYSRLKDFDSEEMQELVEAIFTGSKTLYSNYMLMSEFLLNANLDTVKLEELFNIDNFSINRVKHIISFSLLGKKEGVVNEKLFLERIVALNDRKRTIKTTFIENAFSDLLIAQELYSLKRFGKIYTLLRKYENNLDRIEVLELRIFMEAFIQVGAFKNGDSLGPALQYMAIKKCRQYGFSRLENKLLDYLSMQGNDTLRLK